MAARPGAEPDKSQQVIEALTAAFIQGRLDKDEFDQRVAAALAAYAELHALTADIPAAAPAVPSPAPSRAEPEQLSREAYNKGLAARATFGGAGGVMLVLFIVVTAVSGNPFLGFMLSGVVGAFMVVLLGTVTTLMLWILESSGGKSPRTQPPEARGSSAEPLAPPGQDSARRPRRDTWHTAEATA